SRGSIVLNLASSLPGEGSVVVMIQSLSNPQISASATATLDTGIAQSTTTLMAVPNPGVAGQKATLTGKITGSTRDVPGGLGTFFDGSTMLGTATLDATGTATLNVPTIGVFTIATSTVLLSPGSHSITASYSGDSFNTPSTSNTVVLVVSASIPA